MSLEGRKLGAALMEENAKRLVSRIPHATFGCVVFADDLEMMGAQAWETCKAYFGNQPFEITDLDAESNFLHPPGGPKYTGHVRARAV